MANAYIRCALILLMALPAVQARAEDKQAARVQEQVHRLRQQVQQLQQAQQQSDQKMAQDRAAADEQIKRSSSELGVASKKLKSTERDFADLQARFKAMEQERDALTARLADTSRKLTELDTLQHDTAAKLRARDDDANGLRASLSSELAERKRCEANNIALYQYGRELMSLYENKGVLTALRQGEPVLGLGQVKVENMLEEYRDKLDAQKRAGLTSDASSVAPAAGKP